MAVQGASAYLTGATGDGLPTTPGAYQPRIAGGRCSTARGEPFACPDAFVLKLSPDGTKAMYATYLGGAAEEMGTAITVDPQGNAYVAGNTASADFPTTFGVSQRAFHRRIEFGPLWFGDGFVTMLSPSGSALVYSTFLGGAGVDVVNGIALDRANNVTLAGGTQSSDFPVNSGAFQPVYGGADGVPSAFGDGFVTRLNSLGAILTSTFLGGRGADRLTGVAVDDLGQTYVLGETVSADFPPGPDAIPTCRRPELQGMHPFVAQLSASGDKLLRATPLAGLGLDQGSALALDSHGALYVAGLTRSLAFFTTPLVAQTRYSGGDTDAFLAKIDLQQPPGRVVACVLNAASLVAGVHPVFQEGSVAPGEIVSLFGTDLGPGVGVAGEVAAGQFRSALAGTRVLFDGIPSPLLYVAANQVNSVVPFEVKPPGTRLTVERNGTTLGPMELPVVDAVPAIFTAQARGSGPAAALNQDGTVNSASNPAQRGTVVALFATGAGLTSPAGINGNVIPLGPPFPAPTLPVAASIGGLPAAVQYAGAAPGLVSGVVQLNLRVPDGIGPDAVPVRIAVGGVESNGTVTIAVR